MAPSSICFSEVGNISLAYETFGDPGAPAIILIMGLGAQMHVWPDSLCERLANRGFQVIRFDNRDIGLSSKLNQYSHRGVFFELVRERLGKAVNADYNLTDMAKDVVGLMDSLEIRRAHIVGASMGGMIAQTMAANWPNRVKSLTSIMSTSSGRDLPGPSLGTLARLLVQPLSGISHPRGLEHRAKMLQAIGSKTFPTSTEEIIRRIAKSDRHCSDRRGVQRQFKAILASGCRRSVLSQIETSTLVIHGDEDPLFPQQCGEDTARHLPNARFELVSGMGHDFPAPLLSRLERLMGGHVIENEDEYQSGSFDWASPAVEATPESQTVASFLGAQTPHFG